MSNRKLLRLETDRDKHQALVVDLLEEAKAKGMIDVTIMGSLPGGHYCLMHSPSMDRTMQIGYLEQAKFHILEGRRASE